jgi:threo-3-hydroxy-L-aspartate ammonia-lyase
MKIEEIYHEIELAARRIAPEARHTPLVRLPMAGEVYAKLESLQRTGSFKFRGAFNAIAKLPEAVRARGVVSASSGNHAQGVALAAQLFGIAATIVIPASAPALKIARTRALGATVVHFGRTSDEGKVRALEIAAENGASYIPPFDHGDIIAGQGTIGLEILADLPTVATVLVCVGGGGLLAGIVSAIKYRHPGVRVIGVEPELAADAQASLRSGSRQVWDASLTTRTICDGVRTSAIGHLNFEIISALVDDIVTVSEEAVITAMKFYALEAKQLIEPTAALTLAALQSGAVVASGPTVCIVSGGNVEPAFAAKVLSEI